MKAKKWALVLLLISAAQEITAWEMPRFTWDRLLSESDLRLLNDPDYLELREALCEYYSSNGRSQERTALLMDFVLLEQPKVCVEIGVYAGATFVPVASVLRYLGTGVAYAIDPWSAAETTRFLSDRDLNKNWWGYIDMEEIFLQFRSDYFRWDIHNHCKIMRKTSVVAALEIGPIDFLHIDGNFSELGALRDVELYLPKVKKGGYVLFSDIHWYAFENLPPKLRALQRLLDSCFIVEVIDDNGSLLVKKVADGEFAG